MNILIKIIFELLFKIWQKSNETSLDLNGLKQREDLIGDIEKKFDTYCNTVTANLNKIESYSTSALNDSRNPQYDIKTYQDEFILKNESPIHIDVSEKDLKKRQLDKLYVSLSHHKKIQDNLEQATFCYDEIINAKKGLIINLKELRNTLDRTMLRKSKKEKITKGILKDFANNKKQDINFDNALLHFNWIKKECESCRNRIDNLTSETKNFFSIESYEYIIKEGKKAPYFVVDEVRALDIYNRLRLNLKRFINHEDHIINKYNKNEVKSHLRNLLNR